MAKSKFLPETRGAIVERFAAGLTLPDTALAVGINPTTLKGWLKKGRQQDKGPYADFAAAVDEAKREAKARPEPMDEDELLRVVSESARKGNTQAMKLRWEMICADRSANEEPEAPADPVAAVDELALRRTG